MCLITEAAQWPALGQRANTGPFNKKAPLFTVCF
jgi:hypothetical protein